MSSNIKSFVSEKQIEEKRKARQEEWEKVRKPEDPSQAPEEEEYDPRSLYERLKEQKDKKQEDFEETLKFKNHFRGIDNDESDFLSGVSKRNFELQQQKNAEEKKELEDFRSALAQTRELPEVDVNIPTIEEEKPLPKKTRTIKNNPQQNILKSAVKRKVPPSENIEKKDDTDPTAIKLQKSETVDQVKGTIVFPSVTKCVGVLPGLAIYDEDSDDSDENSSSDESGLLSNNLLSSIVNNPD